MGRESIIPDPILEENRDQYLEELSKISEAEKWVEKHSVQNNANQDETRIIQKENSNNDNFWSKIFTSFVIGFSIPFLTWISLFSSAKSHMISKRTLSSRNRIYELITIISKS